MNPLVEQLLAEIAPPMAAHPHKPAVLYYTDGQGMPRILGEVSNFRLSPDVSQPEPDTPRLLMRVGRPVSEGATRAERRRNDRLARKSKS